MGKKVKKGGVGLPMPQVGVWGSLPQEFFCKYTLWKGHLRAILKATGKKSKKAFHRNWEKRFLPSKKRLKKFKRFRREALVLFIFGGKSCYHNIGIKIGYRWTCKTEFCYIGKHNNGEVHRELNCNILTNCGLVMPYYGIDLSQSWPAPNH